MKVQVSKTNKAGGLELRACVIVVYDDQHFGRDNEEKQTELSVQRSNLLLQSLAYPVPTPEKKKP